MNEQEIMHKSFWTALAVLQGLFVLMVGALFTLVLFFGQPVEPTDTPNG